MQLPQLQSFRITTRSACSRLRCGSHAQLLQQQQARSAPLSQLVFPHTPTLSVNGRHEVQHEQLIEMLSPSVSPERLQRMQQVGRWPARAGCTRASCGCCMTFAAALRPLLLPCAGDCTTVVWCGAGRGGAV